MEDFMSTQKNSGLMDDVRNVIRRKHYSIHTERSYCDWIKRYINFHNMLSKDGLKDGESKIEQFLTHLIFWKSFQKSVNYF